MAVEKIGDDRTAPVRAAMKWRAAGSGFLGSRGMRTLFAGEETCACRCGITIEAKPLCDRTCPIEPAEGPAVATGKEGHRGQCADVICHRTADCRVVFLSAKQTPHFRSQPSPQSKCQQSRCRRNQRGEHLRGIDAVVATMQRAACSAGLGSGRGSSWKNATRKRSRRQPRHP